jgi:hypothetical protein
MLLIEAGETKWRSFMGLVATNSVEEVLQQESLVYLFNFSCLQQKVIPVASAICRCFPWRS